VADFIHKPVLMAEVVESLQIRPGSLCLDGTVGGGGHAAAILKASAPNGRLIGCDRDGSAVAAARARLSGFPGRFEIRQGNYADMAEWVEPESCNGVLLDLGVSSPQLDEPGRGFSFQQDGPLDMRMDQSQGSTAADLLNRLGADELAKIFWEYGGEKDSRRLARAIVQERQSGALERTRQLAALIERISPGAGRRTHPATKVFLALRIAVNDELGSLKRGLEAAVKVLKPGGRLAVITFHSVEDRMVKEFGRRLSRDYEPAAGVDAPDLRRARPPQLRWARRKAIVPGAEEIRENPRSRSAQCRVFEKLESRPGSRQANEKELNHHGPK
jgi:16S rRNA (cytosine1402-N4)-methyltransferase